MLTFILDPRFKHMHPIISCLGHKNVLSLVVDYKFYLLLLLLVEFLQISNAKYNYGG
jgi:hypothetical protein